MKELIEQIAKALVDNPDQVSVKPIEGEQTTVLELRVAPNDLGKVIGKQGRTARSIRTILGAAGMKLRKRFTLEILESGWECPCISCPHRQDSGKPGNCCRHPHRLPPVSTPQRHCLGEGMAGCALTELENHWTINSVILKLVIDAITQQSAWLDTSDNRQLGADKLQPGSTTSMIWWVPY
jgi:predicted RNA-binding protein YlqC (UPF0109 family)